MHANVLKKDVLVWEYATSPARSYGRGIREDARFHTSEMLFFGTKAFDHFYT